MPILVFFSTEKHLPNKRFIECLSLTLGLVPWGFISGQSGASMGGYGALLLVFSSLGQPHIPRRKAIKKELERRQWL